MLRLLNLSGAFAPLCPPAEAIEAAWRSPRACALHANQNVIEPNVPGYSKVPLGTCSLNFARFIRCARCLKLLARVNRCTACQQARVSLRVADHLLS
jgi:hypothetical protein